MKEDPKP